MLRAVFIALLAAPLPAAAAEAHRHHGPHVHGEATLNVGVDGQLLVVGLDAPGMSLLGFEHPPRNDSERARYGQTLDVLRHPEQWQILAHSVTPLYPLLEYWLSSDLPKKTLISISTSY